MLRLLAMNRRSWHYVFTQILRYSHAVLDCASMKAEVWTCPDRLASLEQASGIAEPVLLQTNLPLLAPPFSSS
ncbi:hypothetical protein T10_12731 [Trichinella papuae]|uniref:Uncharacterized protein n=1 Tax=Trichinella papuae TaxID=268474 RepID=A0A0V1N4T7_9BILA|nr:hypothetical protein T10_12731 [Trichinella papuae]